MNPSPEKSPVRLLLVDDHAVVRAGLQAILMGHPRLMVVDMVGTAAGVLPAIAAAKPDVVLLDLRLPDGSGTQLVREIKALSAPPRVVILTSFAEPVEVFAALEAGVDGYLLKDSDGEALLAALVAVANGDQVLHPQIMRLVLGQALVTRPVSPLDRLTPQERRILSLVTEGRTNKEIGAVIGLSEKTVRNLMTGILGKLGVERRQQAVALFVKEQAKAA